MSVRTRVIVLNSPSNPTGGVLSREVLEHIADAARQRDLWVITDEIYARLSFDAPAISIASLPGMAERTVICDGFSKTYAMTGGAWASASCPNRRPSGSSYCSHIRSAARQLSRTTRDSKR